MQKLESLGQLTGGLAHDFNNLLMVVLASLQLASKQAPAGSKLATWLDRARDAAEAGAVLTKRMLAFARRQVLKPETVYLADVVQGMSDMMAHSLGPAVRIEVDIPAELPPVRIDRNQLEVALLDLGVNARDAMQQGERCRFAREPPKEVCQTAFPRGNMCSFRSPIPAPDGRGDTEARLRALLHDQGDGQGVRARNSPMVQGLSLQSGGAMRIASRPGEGCTVSLWLPVALQRRARDRAGST